MAATTKRRRTKRKGFNGKLTEWLLEVLKHQAHDATIPIPGGRGREALVKLDGNLLIAYEYVGPADEEVWLSVLEFPNV